MNTEEALVERYKQLLAFYLHEDKLLWDIYYICIAINSAVVSALAIIISTTEAPANIVYVLCAVGIMVNLLAELVFSRSRIYIDSARFQAQMVEKTLEDMGLPFRILLTQELIKIESKTLKSHKGEYRKLRIWEKISAWILIRLSVAIMAILWLIFGIAFFLKVFA